MSTIFEALSTSWQRYRSPADAAHSLLADLCRNGGLQPVFRFLLANDTVATRNVQDSYRHDNGFTKLLLLAAPTDEFKVRLHVWPKPYGSEHNIHDHRFNFWSAVLRGTLRNTIWTLGPGEERQHYKYYPRKAQAHYRLERVGPATLARERQFDVHQDASYCFDNSLLHTVESHGAAVTLLIEDRTSLRPFANVFISTTSTSSLVIDSPSLTLDEYRAELLHCAEELPMA